MISKASFSKTFFSRAKRVVGVFPCCTGWHQWNPNSCESFCIQFCFHHWIFWFLLWHHSLLPWFCTFVDPPGRCFFEQLKQLRMVLPFWLNVLHQCHLCWYWDEIIWFLFGCRQIVLPNHPCIGVRRHLQDSKIELCEKLDYFICRYNYSHSITTLDFSQKKLRKT